MIKKCKVLVCLFLLCFQFIPFSLVFAETVADTPTSDSTTLSSKAEDIIKQTTDSSKEVSKEPTEEQPLRHEDHIFLEQEQSNVSMPVVLLEEKRLEQGIFLHGKMIAGSEIQKNLSSETMITSLVLQQAVGDSAWQDHHTFITNKEAVNLTTDGFQLDFEEGLETEGSYRYRLIADYTVKYFEGESLVHSEAQKGSLELGTVDVSTNQEEVTEPKEVVVEEPVIEEPKPIPEESTESEAVQEEVEEPVKIPVSPNDLPSQDIQTLGANPQVPQLEDDYRHAFQRGMGIMPLASNNATYTRGPMDSAGGSGGAVYQERVSEVNIIEAKYTSKTMVKAKFEVKWQYATWAGSDMSTEGLYATMNGVQYYINISFSDSGNHWKTNNLYGDINQSHITRTSGTRVLSNFTNVRSVGSYYRQSNYTYYAIAYNTSTFEISDIPVNVKDRFNFLVSHPSFYNHNRYFEITFNGPNVTDLTAISTPNFTAIDGNTSTVNMAAGTYTGDISDNLNDGVLQLSTNNGGAWSNHISNLNHTNSRNGTYAARSVGSLAAGSEYLGRVALKDWLGTWKYSGNRVFYTPNSVNQPAVTTLNTPTTASNATAALTATYNVGARPAHASAVEVQRSTDNSTWTTVSASPAINTSTRQVTYTLTGLAPNTTYYTRYRVKNASTKWSPWSASRSFATRGVALKVSTPTVNQGGATASQIVMNAGTYTGNASTNTADKNTGIVRISADNGSSWTNKTTTLVHGTSLNGSYNGLTITGLTAGSTYRVQVALKDAARAYQYSSQTTFYTPNTANTPSTPTLNTPTTASNATAAFIATYVAGTTPAHPTGANVQVQVSENGGTFTNASLVATPVVNTGAKQVTFTVKDLKAKTNYRVQYRVKNASGVWSNWGTMANNFRTKGIGLKVNPPVFDQDSATSSTIQMKSGTYTGDVSQSGNTGEVYTQSYDNTGSGGTKDWTLRVGNLTHTKTTNGTYSAATITGLDAGTRYRGWIRIKDFENNFSANIESSPQYFYTTNVVNKPSVLSLGTPTTPLDATASLNGQYVVGTKTGQTPVHPTETKVRVSLDGTNWQEVSSSTEPQLTSATINTGGSVVDFSLSKLKANTKYYVQYCVRNQGGWSSWSVSEEITTLSPPPGIYLTKGPNFDFGMLRKEVYSQTANLTSESVKDHVEIDNSDTTKGWSLSVKLEELKRTDNPSIIMPWANLRMAINLQKTTDSGVTWTNYTTGVTGSPRTVTISSGAAAQSLWSIANPTDSQGTFRNEIDWSNVELEVPGNLNGYYQGKLIWSLDSIP